MVTAYEAAKENSGASQKESQTSGIQLSMLDQLSEKVANVEGTKYTLGMNRENLNSQNRDKLALIEASCPDLYQAYQLKERLRVILHCKDVDLVRSELTKWITDARNSGLTEFVPMADKIERHIENILRSVESQANSARSESTNTTIKALIKTARGFANLDNMFALIMLRCSDLTVPLHNRYQPSHEVLKSRREKENLKRAMRLDAKRTAQP